MVHDALLDMVEGVSVSRVQSLLCGIAVAPFDTSIYLLIVQQWCRWFQACVRSCTWNETCRDLSDVLLLMPLDGKQKREGWHGPRQNWRKRDVRVVHGSRESLGARSEPVSQVSRWRLHRSRQDLTVKKFFIRTTRTAPAVEVTDIFHSDMDNLSQNPGGRDVLKL